MILPIAALILHASTAYAMKADYSRLIFSEKARARTLVCGSEAPCSPSIAQVQAMHYSKAIDDSYSESCVGALVGPDLALVPAVCVPADLRRNRASCLDRAVLTFSESYEHPEYERTLRCDQVVRFQEAENGKLADGFAILKLTQPSRRPTLRLTRRGFSPLERIKFLGVTDSQGVFAATAVTRDCRAIQPSPAGTGKISAGLCDESINFFQPGSVVVSEDGLVLGMTGTYESESALNDHHLEALASKDSLVPKRIGLIDMACADFPESLNLGPPKSACNVKP